VSFSPELALELSWNDRGSLNATAAFKDMAKKPEVGVELEPGKNGEAFKFLALERDWF